jgi:hypothetical protein
MESTGLSTIVDAFFSNSSCSSSSTYYYDYDYYDSGTITTCEFYEDNDTQP